MSQEREVADRIVNSYYEFGPNGPEISGRATWCDAIATALRTAREEGYRQGVGARVKPLVWTSAERAGQTVYDANSVVGRFSVEPMGNRWSYHVPGVVGPKAYPGMTFDEAQTAAQRDYEQRIMSALAEPGDRP